MALLDELLIRIVADTSGVRNDIDRSRRAADDLTDDLQDTENQAKRSGEAMAGFAAKALGALTAALSVGGVISSAMARANDIEALHRTSEALGVAIGDLDAFGRAAELAGGDAQGARDSITDMAEKMGEALSDAESGAAKAFKALNIGLKNADGSSKNALEGLLDLAGAVEGLDKTTAVFKIKELGITDNRTVEMVLKGRKELERMLAVQKAQGVVTKEAAERAKAFTEGLNALKGSLNAASNSFFDTLIPALTKAVEWLTKIVDWAGEHKDLIVGFFIAVAGIVTALYLPAMISAAAATLAATWPLLLIIATLGALAAGFALVYDDVMNFIEGNDSLIGQIFEKYPAVKDVVMALIDAFRALWDILTTGAAQIGTFVSNAFMQIVQGIKFAIDYLTEAYGSISEFVANAMGSFQSLADGVKAIFSAIASSITGALDIAKSAIGGIKGALKTVAGAVGIEISGDDPQPAENQPPKPSGSGQAASDVPMVDSYAPSQQERPESQARISDVAAQRSASNQGVSAANNQLLVAKSAPTNNVTSSAITNSTQNRTSNVDIGQVTIQTQATDAQGIARDTSSELSSQLKNLEHESATGISR